MDKAQGIAETINKIVSSLVEKNQLSQGLFDTARWIGAKSSYVGAAEQIIQ